MTTKTTKPAKKTGEQIMVEDATKATAVIQTVDAMAQEKLDTNQLLGRIQATTAISGMLEALSLSQLEQVKRDKIYQNLKGQLLIIDDKEYDLGTWAGFCKGIGSSERAVDEKLQNLHLLGEIALENATAIGMTRGDLRRLRKLDPSDQNVIIGELEANIGDKDAIVELIENMSAKHVKEKEALQAKIDDEKAERQASDQVIAKKNDKIDELEKRLAKEENATPYDRATMYAQEISKVETEMLALFAKVDKLFQSIGNEPEIPTILRVNQGHFLLELKDQSNRLIDAYQLGDVSVDDDQLDWIAAAKAEYDEDAEPDWVKNGEPHPLLSVTENDEEVA